MSEQPLPALCAPLKLPIEERGTDARGLEGCAAWIPVSSDRLRRWVEAVRRVRALKEASDSPFGQWPIMKDPELASLDVHYLPSAAGGPDAGPAVGALPRGLASGHHEPVLLPPEFPLSALGDPISFQPTGRLHVDATAVVWEARCLNGPWSHTRAVGEQGLVELARLVRLWELGVDERRVAFRELAREQPFLAGRALSLAQLERALAVDGVGLAGAIDRSDVRLLLDAGDRSVREAALRTLGRSGRSR